MNISFSGINTAALKRRAWLITINSLNSLASPFLNILLSIAAVRFLGGEAWGMFVYQMLIASLASLFLNWGNRDYLLREFSREPSALSKLWWESFFTRLLLILPAAFVLWLMFSPGGSPVLIFLTFLLFAVQSFDVLINFRRKFKASLLAEILTGAFLLGAVLTFRGIIVQGMLIYFYVVYLLVKSIVYFILFRKVLFTKIRFSVNSSMLKDSFPFFLLGLTGMLGSRIDQYCVTYYLPVDDLGRYQVLKSFLIYFQAAGGFIIMPFVKNIYRLREKSAGRIASMLFLAGMVLVFPMMFLLFVVMEYVYLYSYSPGIYIYSALNVLPVYYYSVIVYRMFRLNRQSAVVLITSAGIIVSFVLSVTLIPVMNISGALIAGAASGAVTAVIYKLANFG